MQFMQKPCKKYAKKYAIHNIIITFAQYAKKQMLSMLKICKIYTKEIFKKWGKTILKKS